jgi:lysyl-tRNA synthetase class I
MTELALEPCPFCYPHPACDEYPPYVTQEIVGSNSWCVWARCCDFYGPLFATPELAAAAWNRRGMVTKLEDKETIDLFEGILGADPQAFLTDSIVYSVTQNELLKFASVLAPRHAMEAVERLQRRLTAERQGVEDYEAQQNLAVTALEEELAHQTKSATRWEKRYEQQKGCARSFKCHRDQLRVDLDVTHAFLGRLVEDLECIDDAAIGQLNSELLESKKTEARELVEKIKSHERFYSSPGEVINNPEQALEEAKRLCVLLNSDRKDVLDFITTLTDDADLTDEKLVADLIEAVLNKMDLRRDEIFQISDQVFKDHPQFT